MNGTSLFDYIFHLFDETLENICHCFIGVHYIISEIKYEFLQERTYFSIVI